jgi:hypothetical protein
MKTFNEILLELEIEGMEDIIHIQDHDDYIIFLRKHVLPKLKEVHDQAVDLAEFYFEISRESVDKVKNMQ